MERGTEQESLEVCANEGLGVLPWSPLKGYVMLQYELKAVAIRGFLEEGAPIREGVHQPIILQFFS